MITRIETFMRFTAPREAPPPMTATQERDRETFRVRYAPELGQYVVERGCMRVVPTRSAPEDKALARAQAVHEVLTRVYAEGAATAVREGGAEVAAETEAAWQAENAR